MDIAFYMHFIKFNKSIAAVMVGSMLAACGSGGESNAAPTISVADATFKERAQVTVPATITDADGSVSKISWVQKSGVAATLVDASNATLTFKAPDVTKDEILVFTVSVTDNAGAVATKDVSVTVKNNLLPTLEAANGTVAERKNGQLQATATDSDGTIVSYVWTQKSGPASTLTTATTNTLSFTAPVVTQDETLVFNVKATDDTGESVDKDVQVLVVNNRLPTVEASNVSTRERAATQLQMKASDVDGSIVSYSWTQKTGTKATLTTSNAATLNFNAPVVTQDEVLVFTATATDDSSESSSRDVQVAVNNNLLPVITANNANARELAAVTLTAAATDGDGTVAGYKWTQKSGVAVSLANTNTAVLSFSAPSVSKNEVLVFTVEATDNDGETSTKDVTVNVANNNAPVVNVAGFSINEKMPVTIAPTITDADGDEVTVKWTQKSGLAITNSTLSGNSYNFVAPDISKKDEVLTFTVTATDALGDITTKDVTVTLVANVEKLTFSGMISVSTMATKKYPVVGPKVTIQVGGSSQTVDTTNATGSYTAEVVIDEKDYNEQVRIIAEAESPTYFKLVSELGNIQDVLALAGSDKLITSQDHSGLWVTEVTTALHGLMQLANNNQPITTKEQFEAAQLAYDGSKLLDVALAIKLIVENQQPYPGLTPPTGFGDTEALSRDIPRVATYLASATKALPTIVKQSKDSMINEKVAAVVDVNKLYGSYWLQQVDNFSSEGEYINLGNNGGQFINSEVVSNTQWLNNAGNITVDYYPTMAGKGLLKLNSRQTAINGALVQEDTYLQSTWIKIVDLSDTAATLLVKHTYVKKYPNSQLADFTEVGDVVARKALKFTALANAMDIITVGSTYSLPMPATNDVITQAHSNATTYQRNDVTLKILSASTAELSRIVVNGSGGVTKESENVTYIIDSSGILEVYSEGNVFPYRINVFMWNKTTPTRVSVRTFNLGGDNTKYHQVVNNALVKQETAWTNSSVPGIYDLQSNYPEPLINFWQEFYADGTVKFVSTYDWDNDGELTASDFTITSGLWQISDDGTLVTRRYRNLAGYCTSTVWDTAISDSCILHEERVWSPYQQSDNRYVFNMFRRIFFTPNMRQTIVPPWTSVTNISREAWSTQRIMTKLATRPIAIPAGVVANAHGQDLQTQSEPVQIPLLQRKEAARELHFD